MLNMKQNQKKENTKSKQISCCDLLNFFLGLAIIHQSSTEGCRRESSVSCFASGALQTIKLTYYHLQSRKLFCEGCSKIKYPEPVYNPLAAQLQSLSSRI
jgi:hypothetical protein